MHARLVLILLLTRLCQAIIQNTTINVDAAEITRLNHLLRSSSPPIFHRSQSLVCEMINVCCPFIKPRLANYIGDTIAGSSALMTACIGDYPSQSALNQCPTLTKFIPVAQDEEFYKYANALRQAMMEIHNPDITIPQQCSSDEAYATICDWNNRQKIESCERKKLIYMAKHHRDHDYHTLVLENKKNLRLFIDAVKKAFPTVNIIETTTLSSDSAHRTIWKYFLSLNLLFVIFL